jgi:uncharacterized repeat protein (TIGR01451 family)
MTSPSTTDARRLGYAQHRSLLIMWLCFMIVLAAATSVSAQTPITPTTNTVIFSDSANNDPASVNTAPVAGIVMQGTAISAFTGQPVRHLWVADGFAGPCRMDPELDAPGPWDITFATCSFAVNSGGAAIPIGGQFAYDPARHFLYFADNSSASQGIIRMGFDPSGDDGQGALDLSTVFTLGGGAGGRKATFLGGLGCPLGVGQTPNGAALSPDGDLWVSFLDSGEIYRFNSPGTATDDGFISCAQFVQLVATTPDGATSAGLAWIGHDLWSADGTSPFVIPNADTTCLVPPSPACSTANGTVIPTLADVAAPVTIEGDQHYPATNGNNLYFAVGSQIAWVGNVAGGPAGQTETLTYINDPNPTPPLAAVSATGLDTTDPANLVIYSAEDPGAVVVPIPPNGQARWWRTTQTSAAPDVPGTPQHVVAVAGNAQIKLSWSPQQVAQPVTSYTVRNSFISAGSPLADITVNPAPGGIYPPTSIVIPAINGVSYAFEVLASNDNGSSPFSAQSNIVTPPGVLAPSAPTGATAIAGDTQAFVTWTVSASNGGSPITSYTVSIIANGVPTGITVPAPPPTFGSNTDSALIGGLTNGVSYTFTVHASNIAGDSAESAPSNAIVPSAANLPTLTTSISGVTSVTATPAQLTYTITVTNTSHFPANASVTNTLSTVASNITSISRSASGVVTVTLSAPASFAFNQQVAIAGVTDPSFNGTFSITSVPTNTSFTYSQAGAAATSGSGTVTILPASNIVSVNGGVATCTAGGTNVISFSCNIGAMDPGVVVRIPFIVRMAQDQAITNTATASGTDTAGTPLATSSATARTDPPPPPPNNTGITTDLAVTGKADHGSGNVNSANGYTWVVSNKGVDAPNVVFKQVIPSGLRFTSATTNSGTCTGPAVNSLGGTVTCTAATLPNLGTITIIVKVSIAAKGTWNSTGTVQFDGIEAKPGNESFTVVIKGQ